MNTQKDRKFREMIRSIGLDRPSVDFTQVIMEELQADAEGERVANAELKSLVLKATTETPSSSFTYNAMKQVTLRRQQPSDQPIISRVAWLMAAAITVCSLFLLMIAEPGSVSVTMPGLDAAFGSLYKLVGEIPYAYVLTVVSAGAVLLIDYVLSHRPTGGRPGTGGSAF